MSKTPYSEFDEINVLQTSIMRFISLWVHKEKTPIPQSEIILAMKEQKQTKVFTTVNALNALLRKNYIRRAYTRTNKTFYVQLRSI